MIRYSNIIKFFAAGYREVIVNAPYEDNLISLLENTGYKCRVMQNGDLIVFINVLFPQAPTVKYE